MKKVLALMLAVAMIVLCFASCGNSGDTASNSSSSTAATLKVGAILVGDETEGYTLAHMNGISAAIEALKAEGKTVEIEYKKKVPETDAVSTNALDLIADGCTTIITNSYGHQFHLGDVVKDNSGVTFVSMTGDLAASSGLSNYVNAFTDVYESRYVSGVVAGMKIDELIKNGTLTKETCPTAFDADGNIKIGYVGAFNYAEVVSGYTAFFLGIKSVVSNVAMTVKYTNSWFSEEREAAVAEYLMGLGCVIIGQHADSTGAPAAVQKAHAADASKICYSVGYNVSMLEDAPDVALTSSTNNWEVYYETLFRAMLDKTAAPADWSEGYSKKAVGITTLGTAAAAGTADKVTETEKAIADGTIKVFDCSKFTVGGANITSYDKAYGFEGNECIKTEGGVTYFDESSLRSAPYFDIRIDGITEITSDYEAAAE